VNNAKYWVAKCDLLEKAKFALFHAGIVPARPQMDIHHFNNGYPGPVVGIDPENDDELASGGAAGAEAEVYEEDR